MFIFSGILLLNFIFNVCILRNAVLESTKWCERSLARLHCQPISIYKLMIFLINIARWARCSFTSFLLDEWIFDNKFTLKYDEVTKRRSELKNIRKKSVEWLITKIERNLRIYTQSCYYSIPQFFITLYFSADLNKVIQKPIPNKIH